MGTIIALYLGEHECLMGYLELVRQTLTAKGLPQALYTDKAGVFCVNTKKPEHWTLEEQFAGKALDKTQFGRIAEQLGIEPYLRSYPSSKRPGRAAVGYLLQDRLPVWFRLNDITSIKESDTKAGL